MSEQAISSTYMPFARDPSGRLVTPYEVTKGLDCRCRCLCCNSRLVNRRGKVRIPHFSHLGTGAGSCKGARETVLHLAAKKVITEGVHLLLPSGEAKVSEVDRFGRKLEEKKELFPAKTVEVQSARQEERQRDFIPDVTAMVDGKELYVEIHVTNATGARKKSKLREREVSTIEISINASLDLKSSAELAEHVLSKADRKWLHNSAIATALPALRAKVANRLDAEKTKLQRAREAVSIFRGRNQSEFEEHQEFERIEDLLADYLWSKVLELDCINRSRSTPDMDVLYLIWDLKGAYRQIKTWLSKGKFGIYEESSYTAQMDRLLGKSGGQLYPLTWAKIENRSWELIETADRMLSKSEHVLEGRILQYQKI